MNVDELTGADLNEAVAGCLGIVHTRYKGQVVDQFWNPLMYDDDWSLAGPIIEREGMALNMEDTHEWRAAMWWDDEDSKGDILMVGPTPLIAAMRCYVISKLGDEVELPKELS